MNLNIVLKSQLKVRSKVLIYFLFKFHNLKRLLTIVFSLLLYKRMLQITDFLMIKVTAHFYVVSSIAKNYLNLFLLVQVTTLNLTHKLNQKHRSWARNSLYGHTNISYRTNFKLNVSLSFWAPRCDHSSEHNRYYFS